MSHSPTVPHYFSTPPLPPPSPLLPMAARWEMQAMNMYFDTAPTVSSAGAATSIFPYGLPSADTLRIEDLLDFTSLDLLPSSASANANAVAHHPPPPPPPAAVHDSVAFTDDHFIPCEEAAELEWLSQFVEDSFSSNPYPPIPAVRQAAAARSKRPPSSDYQSYLMHAAPTSSSTSSSSSDIPSRASGASSRRKRGGEEGDGGARRCTHCASERTPQWRTGPMGPKTLCNACGVRYKSGRLVPEYRPASSPTFVLTQHSNSHRKVMELRRQKEHVVLRHHDGGGAGGGAAEMMYNDYEVC